jgi:hypothetical protein
MVGVLHIEYQMFPQFFWCFPEFVKCSLFRQESYRQESYHQAVICSQMFPEFF